MKAAALIWGDWQQVEAQVREGLACLRFLEADENEIKADRLEVATDDFRERRNLIAAEEMTRWLAERGIETEEWIGYVERALARERCAGEIAEIVRDFPVEDDGVGAELDCEGICSGAAAAAARKLAAVAAVATERGTLGASIEMLAATFDEIQTGAITAESMERMLELRRLDWTILECRLARFADEDSAREAALCVLEEGEDLGHVASEAGTRVEESTFLLEQIGADLQATLLSAPQGELVGPLPFEGRPTLFVVVSKKPPDESDPKVRAEAERALVAAAIDHHTRETRFHLEL